MMCLAISTQIMSLIDEETVKRTKCRDMYRVLYKLCGDGEGKQ